MQQKFQELLINPSKLTCTIFSFRKKIIAFVAVFQMAISDPFEDM